MEVLVVSTFLAQLMESSIPILLGRRRVDIFLVLVEWLGSWHSNFEASEEWDT